MKRLPIYIIFIAFLALVSCTDRLADEGNGGFISLSVNSMDMQTKASVQGITDYNENLLSKLDVYFFVDGGAEGGQNSLMHYTCAPGSQITGSVNIPTGEAFVNTQLIASPHTACDVYVIANYPGTLPETGTLATLRAQTLTADFVSTIKQTNFVMEGLGRANLVSRTAKVMASGTIPVYRVANKLTLNVSVEEQVIAASEAGEEEQTWTPEIAGLRVRYFNAVGNATVGATDISVETATRFNNPLGSDHTELGGRTSIGTTTVGERIAYTFEPFYSYPSKWDMGSNNQPYIMVSIPWTTTVGGNQRTINCFYKLLLKGTSFDRNVWQVINFHLGALGALTEEAPTVPTTQEYYVLDWGHVGTYEYFNVNAEIKGARYLVVEQLYHEVNNHNTYTFEFKSSHNCEIVNVRVTKPNYSAVETSTTNVSGGAAWLTVNNDNRTVTLNHNLDNDLSGTTYDYVPYTITFRLRHSEEGFQDSFFEDITIVQYPAMYINPERNTYSSNKGRVYVDNAQSTDSRNNSWRYVAGLGDSQTSSNPNMYIVKVTQFYSGDNIIADPRSTTAVRGTTGTGGIGYALNRDANNRTLTYYYPTSTEEGAENIVAPKFRICSSYGRLGSGSCDNLNEAKYRCASYQEAGYPAGRWRVPTSAELIFIGKLCAEGKIPAIFTNGNTYWSATGAFSYNSTRGTFVATDEASYVRCVYDEWYWENIEPQTVDPSRYTFGDQQR